MVVEQHVEQYFQRLSLTLHVVSEKVSHCHARDLLTFAEKHFQVKGYGVTGTELPSEAWKTFAQHSFVKNSQERQHFVKLSQVSSLSFPAS